jgi:hypothetical protein
MIANTSDVRVQGTLSGEKHELAIDPAAMAHIMTVLTDLYSDPAKAVIREYSTNARDAHVEAGNTSTPIEVQLPSPLSPFLKIRDYGVGLTESDIAEIYSRYGASTKRSTNSQTGMLGLGCKSALTYVQQFTLVSIKDGKRIQVAITREATGGSMTVVDERDTDEASGTEVQIPAKRDADGSYKTLDRTAAEFFAYWPKGQVLVNGSEPETVWDRKGFWLTKNMLVRPFADSYRQYDPQHQVVMGNVAYPLDGNYIDFPVARGHEVVVFLGIGEVNFVPSREALNYSDDRTVARVKKLGDEFSAAADKAVQREIDKAKTGADAIARMIESATALYNNPDYTRYAYKGKTIPQHYTVPGAVLPNSMNAYKGNVDDPAFRMLEVPRKSYTKNRADGVYTLPVTKFAHSLFVVGYEGKKFSAPQKDKLTKFLAEHATLTEEAIQTFILLKDRPAAIESWLAPDRIVKWDDVNALKLERQNGGTYGGYKVIPGSYENAIVNGASVGELAAKDIDTKHPVYTYSGNWYNTRSYIPLLDKLVGKYTIVPLPANRFDKFMRNFPNAVNLTEEVRKMYDKWVAGLSADTKLAMTVQADYAVHSLKALDASKVDDPALKQAIKLAKIDLTNAHTALRMFETVRGTGSRPSVKWDDPLEQYPLVSERVLRTAEGRKHAYLYLNAAYAA